MTPSRTFGPTDLSQHFPFPPSAEERPPLTLQGPRSPYLHQLPWQVPLLTGVLPRCCSSEPLLHSQPMAPLWRPLQAETRPQRPENLKGGLQPACLNVGAKAREAPSHLMGISQLSNRWGFLWVEPVNTFVYFHYSLYFYRIFYQGFSRFCTSILYNKFYFVCTTPLYVFM